MTVESPCIFLMCFFFFFSSRRRHTRSLCDWSSDVCSSDLRALTQLSQCPMSRPKRTIAGAAIGEARSGDTSGRSEERRVGKECRSRWSPDQEKKKEKKKKEK